MCAAFDFLEQLGGRISFRLGRVAILEQRQKPRIEIVADEIQRNLRVLEFAITRVIQLKRRDPGALGIQLRLEKIPGCRIEAADLPTMTQERFDGPFVYFAQI